MRKLIPLLLLLLPVTAFAANTSRVTVQGTVDDGNTKFVDTGSLAKSFTTGVIQTQSITATGSAFTAITIPSGAKAVLLNTSVRGLVLKGVTGDKGISMDSSCPILLPLSSDSSTMLMGVQNVSADSSTFSVFFF